MPTSWFVLHSASAPMVVPFAQGGLVEPLPWWQIVMCVVALAAFVASLVFAYRLSQSLKATFNEIERGLFDRHPTLRDEASNDAVVEDVIAIPDLLLVDLAHFALRFIVLYIVQLVWGVLYNLIVPFLANFIAFLFQDDFAVVNILAQWSSTIGSLLILLVLGVPLVLDLVRTFGITLTGSRNAAR